MKISCNREQLLTAFQTVATVAPARSPKAILQNVKLDADPERIALSATDLEISIRHAVAGVDVQTAGSALLSVTRFGSILRESVDETLQIEADGSGVTIRGQRSQFQLPAASPTEFPTVNQFDGTDFCVTPSRLLRELIRRTTFATESESSRYALGGVKLEFQDGQIMGIGTDGRRLARMAGPATVHGQAIDPNQNTIVPTKAMTLIERAVASSDAEVKLAVRGSELVVESQRATIFARLLEGRFPDWRKVLPDEHGAQRIELPVGPTLAAVRQAAIATSDESRGVEFTFAEGTLILAGRAADVGQSRIEMPIGYDGEKVSIMLDPRFVMDFLKVLDPEKTFTLLLTDGDTAVVCSTDDGFAYVIMPLARDR